MAESPDGTTIDGPEDGPIVDQHGVFWRLTAGHQVTTQGFIDHSIFNVRLLKYQGQVMWAKTASNGWFSKTRVDRPWQNQPLGPPGLSDGEVLSRLTQIMAAQVGQGNAINGIVAALEVVSEAVQHILEQVTKPSVDLTPVSVRFAVPTFTDLKTKEPVTMPLNIVDDLATRIPIIFDNRAGAQVPAPSGETATITLSNTDNFAAQLAADGQSVLVWAIQPPTDGATSDLTYTGTDPSGGSLTTTLAGLIIAADNQATSVNFDTTHVTTEAIPTAPAAPAAGDGTNPAAPTA